MPLRFFHMFNGHTILDDHGTELPDLPAVQNEAIRAARELMSLGSNKLLWTGEPWKVWVTDEANGGGLTLVTIEMSGSSFV